MLWSQTFPGPQSSPRNNPSPPKKILLPDVPKHDKFVIPDLEIPSHIENKPAQEIVINPIQKPKIREPVIDIEEPIAYPQSKIHEQQFKERNYGYMSLWQFNQVKDDLNSTRDTLKDCEDIAEKLNVLKNKEDNAYTSWKGSLEIIERKLSYIEGTLFK